MPKRVSFLDLEYFACAVFLLTPDLRPGLIYVAAPRLECCGSF